MPLLIIQQLFTFYTFQPSWRFCSWGGPPGGAGGGRLLAKQLNLRKWHCAISVIANLIYCNADVFGRSSKDPPTPWSARKILSKIPGTTRTPEAHLGTPGGGALSSPGGSLVHPLPPREGPRCTLGPPRRVPGALSPPPRRVLGAPSGPPWRVPGHKDENMLLIKIWRNYYRI